MDNAEVYTVVINGNNVVSGSNNSSYTFSFQQTINFKEAQVALQSLSLYYSWVNISAAYGNNTFQYVWYGSGTSSTTTNVTIPDGYYQVSDINAYLQSVMYANHQYLINGTNIVYYLEITTNSSAYAVQINSYPIPTSLPAGYTAPSGWPGYPTTGSTPLFVVLSNAFQQTIGFSVGSYPAVTQNTNYSVLSSSTPQVTPVESVLINCSLLYNKIAIPSNVLYSFSSANTTYGNVISVIPPYLVYQPIKDGSYPSVTITFTDQNYNTLSIKDTNLVMLLSIKIPKSNK